MQPSFPGHWAPSPWFLTSPPQQASQTLRRSRLWQMVDSSLAEARVVVVSAPSGFGKTALLASWHHMRTTPTAWLTLTRHERDDEPLLLSGILGALTRVTGRLASQPEAPPVAPETSATGLSSSRVTIGRIAEVVASLSHPVVIVIDDAHHGGAVLSEIVDTVSQLTHNLLRFVLAGGTELTTSFARRLAAGGGTMITAADLALTIDELLAAAAASGIDLDEAAAQHLHEETRGWPMALHLWRLTDQRAAWRTGLLVDYVTGDILPKLPSPLRAFVLAATTCERLDAGMATALTGADDAATLLEECVADGLFLERYPDDSERVVYRWHPCFADACRHIVQREDPARARNLHRIAARALAPMLPAEAIVHALRADDTELAQSLIRTNWVRILVEGGARSLSESCLRLPGGAAEDPCVLLIRAACLNLLTDRDGARYLAASGIALADPNDEQFAATRAYAELFIADDDEALLSATERALAALEGGASDPVLHAYRLFLIGWTELRLRRDTPRAIQLLQSAHQEADRARRHVLARRAGSNLLFALALAGRFTDAEDFVTMVDEDDGADDWHHYDGGIASFAIGFTRYFRGDVDGARAAFTRTLPDRHEGTYAPLAHVFLAFLAADETPHNGVREGLRLLTGVPRQEQHGVPWAAYADIARAKLALVDGDGDRAMEIVLPLLNVPRIPAVCTFAAEVARRAGRPAVAIEALRRLTPQERGISYLAAMSCTTAALIAHEQGDAARARRLLEQALDAAEPERVLLPFRDRTPQMRELLSAHATAGTAHEVFVAERLAALDAATLSGTTAPLSAREREILGYLRTPMTASEIAAALFVSVNTVRTHQRAIYRKLGVSNRREAVRVLR